MCIQFWRLHLLQDRTCRAVLEFTERMRTIISSLEIVNWEDTHIQTIVITLFFSWEYLLKFFFILFLNFTILYYFCQISKWIHHRYTCVSHPEPSSLLPPHTIPLGRPSAPAPSIQYRASSNLDWQLVLHFCFLILKMLSTHKKVEVYYNSPLFRFLNWRSFQRDNFQGYSIKIYKHFIIIKHLKTV